MKSFRSIFDRGPEVDSTASGRVNLMGEHTDYNGGYVLPLPISQATRALLRRNSRKTVRAVSLNVADDRVTFQLGTEKPSKVWGDYVQGLTSIVASEGYPLDGFDLLIDSEVPLGAGLASSASLLIAIGRALRSAFEIPIDDVSLARLAQKVENGFVGAHVGIMDHMACSVGQPGHALFLNTLDFTHEHVPLPADYDWVVIHSGVAHEHAAGDYNTRRAECVRACRLLQLTRLTELTEADLKAVRPLPEPLARRVRHVVTENARVPAACAAIRAGDMAELGRLFNASHDSQRDDYEVSVPAIEELVSHARRQQDVLGVRLTGGGFGGSVVFFTRAGYGVSAAKAIMSAYNRSTSKQPTLILPIRAQTATEARGSRPLI